MSMAKKAGELTPLMKQYWDIKTLHQDKILLFRMGDFYELFYDDAIKASPLLGITLTQRNKKSEDQTPMCGFPHHTVAGPINKLLAAGLKVAICDQIEDPALAKGLVKRAITRILTPGMIYDSETLDQTKAHYLSSFDDESISFIDTTTGEAFYFKSANLIEKLKLLEVLPVVEIVVADDTSFETLALKKSEKYVISVFKTNQKSSSHQLLSSYVQALSQKELLQILRPFEEREFEHRLQVSQTTLRHLEVFSNYKGEEQGSLFQAINRTKTSGGARLLRQWMSFPLRNKKQIEKRYDQIHEFREHMFELKKVRESLGAMGDIERRLGKIAQPQCHGRDLLALAEAALAGLASLKWCEGFYKNEKTQFQKISEDLAQQIQRTISDEAPLSVRQGHMIKKGFRAELDELIDLSTNAHEMVSELERQEKEATGISSLKIRYNQVFGFYIEITNLHKDKAPAHYQRKQTLANAERFCTDELIELEKKVLSAQVKRYDLEFSIFDQLRNEILQKSAELLGLASFCSQLDVITSLAWLSLEESYTRPELNESKNVFIEASRHPVVEQFIRGKFIANTIELKPEQCLLLTGPNMAGKSTLMRQMSLIVLMAQMGSYVPATSAKLPLYDAIYTRIGASDQLSEGLSTFMVEMTETAQLLKSATADSLLILDEVGRGTATFDGMCLAQSILEFILTKIKSHIFFATHYHEMTVLDKTFESIKNGHMKVIDHKNGHIEFLHILSEGSAGQSYGVQVAELAGLPQEITTRAKEILARFEKTENQNRLFAANSEIQVKPAIKEQMSLFDIQENKRKEELIKELIQFQIQKATPLQALNKIAEWQEQLN
jgi:DNA mismatch repair protein MutS